MITKGGRTEARQPIMIEGATAGVEAMRIQEFEQKPKNSII
jgi:hypothetical protein